MNIRQSRRILVVDDDRAFCRALSASLRRRGHEVLVAHDAEEALEEARAWAPTHVVSDLRMPGRSGLELVQHLKEEYSTIEVLILTGYGSIATAVQATKLGAVQYLTKPVSADQILLAFDGQATAQTTSESSAAPLELVEWEHLQRVLLECGGNISETARRLGMHRRTLQRKLTRGRSA